MSSHDEQIPDAMFDDAVKLLAEVSKDTPKRLSAVERAEYVRDAKILGDLMYRSDDYFAVGCTDTEKELDDQLEKWVKSEGVVCDKDSASDLNNLLMWLGNIASSEEMRDVNASPCHPIVFCFSACSFPPPTVAKPVHHLLVFVAITKLFLLSSVYASIAESFHHLPYTPPS